MGLPVGTHLKPLKDRVSSKYSAEQYQYMAGSNFDTARVYFTTDLQLARALVHPRRRRGRFPG